MTLKGPPPKPEVVAYLRKNPKALDLADEDLAKRLINLKFYSASTFWRDIRIARLREAVKEG